jgi:hypothetical protein
VSISAPLLNRSFGASGLVDASLSVSSDRLLLKTPMNALERSSVFSVAISKNLFFSDWGETLANTQSTTWHRNKVIILYGALWLRFIRPGARDTIVWTALKATFSAIRGDLIAQTLRFDMACDTLAVPSLPMAFWTSDNSISRKIVLRW